MITVAEINANRWWPITGSARRLVIGSMIPPRVGT